MAREQEGRRDPALRRIDDRFVPLLQRGGRGLGRALLAPFRLLNLAEERFLGWLFRPLWRRRQILALAAAVITFAGAFVHLERFETDAPDQVVADQGENGAADAGADGPVTAADVVGPSIGDDISTYLDERRAVLDEADGDEERLAVVSFDGYVTVEELVGFLGEDAATVHEVQLRVPAEGEEPFTVEVDGDVGSALEAVVEEELERIADEEVEFQRLLDSGTVTDPEFEEFYEAEVERLRSMRNLLEGGSGIIFAYVVESDVETLRTLAAVDEVRLVDLAEAGTEPDETAFYGLLPEESGTAGFGHFG